MKWIAIVLVLLNVIALLLGFKVDPENVQAAKTSINSSEVDSINAAGISVIIPQDADANEDSGMISEEGLAQLKVDSSGKVLVARDQKQSSEVPKLPVRSKADQSQVQAKAKEMPQAGKGSAGQPSAEKSVVTARAKNSAKTTIPSANPSQSLACYRLGPFANKEQLANTRRKLVDKGVGFKLDEIKAQSKTGSIKVYLGGFANRAALDKQKKRLVQLKIDHFAKTIEGVPAIQLGSFSDEAHALAYQKKLEANGLSAKLHRAFGAASVKSWLELAQVSNTVIAGLDLPKSIRADPKSCP